MRCLFTCLFQTPYSFGLVVGQHLGERCGAETLDGCAEGVEPLRESSAGVEQLSQPLLEVIHKPLLLRQPVERVEVEPLHQLREKLLYWKIGEVVRASELVEELMTLVQRLGLTRPS